jgi:hypothetical protein
MTGDACCCPLAKRGQIKIPEPAIPLMKSRRLILPLEAQGKHHTNLQQQSEAVGRLAGYVRL